MAAISWDKTPEGFHVWSEANKGNYQPYYDYVSMDYYYTTKGYIKLNNLSIWPLALELEAIKKSQQLGLEVKRVVTENGVECVFNKEILEELK